MTICYLDIVRILLSRMETNFMMTIKLNDGLTNISEKTFVRCDGYAL